MTTQTTPQTSAAQPRTHRLIGAIVLITSGIGMLAAQFVDMGPYFFLLLGGAMLLAGIFTRSAGWIIPGGIVSGLGSAIAVMEGPLGQSLHGPQEGGLFLTIFALGFASVAILARLFTRDPQDWAFIPAGVMGSIGSLIFAGTAGLTVLTWMGKLWPVALILVGLGLLLSLNKQR